MSSYEDVKSLYRYMNMPVTDKPTLIAKEIAALRVVYMLEELAEFNKANCDGNLNQCADSLVDLVYFALGTAALMGLPWQEVWTIVHSANLAKMPGTDKYGAPGLVKPVGWISPLHSIDKILRKA